MKGNGKEGVGTGLDVFGSSQKKYLYSESELGCSFPFKKITYTSLSFISEFFIIFHYNLQW